MLSMSYKVTGKTKDGGWQCERRCVRNVLSSSVQIASGVLMEGKILFLFLENTTGILIVVYMGIYF